MSIPPISAVEEEAVPQEEISEVERLRKRHQDAAEEAARSGLIPPQFTGDPTFVQLIAAKKAAA